MRYEMEVLVRPEHPDDWDHSERPIQAVNITASSELEARRQVLERAWANGLLVSQFLTIKMRSVR